MICNGRENFACKDKDACRDSPQITMRINADRHGTDCAGAPTNLNRIEALACVLRKRPLERTAQWLPGRVEEGRGSLGHAATPRFPSPLIKPDVRISRIRLSDRLHRKAHGERPVQALLSQSTPSSP